MRGSNSYEFSKNPTYDFRTGQITCAINDYHNLTKLADQFIESQKSLLDKKQPPKKSSKQALQHEVGRSEVTLPVNEFDDLLERAENGLRKDIKVKMLAKPSEIHQLINIKGQLDTKIFLNRFTQEPPATMLESSTVLDKIVETFPKPSNIKPVAPVLSAPLKGEPLASIHVPIGPKSTHPATQPAPNLPLTTQALVQIHTTSKILNSAEGQKLGKSPLDFLSTDLGKFKKTVRVFATRRLPSHHKTAADFHKACDNVPNVLVIIKSGQYIAGGYTEVPFESRQHISGSMKPNPLLSTFLFSVNRQKKYPLKDSKTALNCDPDYGPSFGLMGLRVTNQYTLPQNSEFLNRSESSFHSPTAKNGELFGTPIFAIDEYEVYKLE